MDLSAALCLRGCTICSGRGDACVHWYTRAQVHTYTRESLSIVDNFRIFLDECFVLVYNKLKNIIYLFSFFMWMSMHTALGLGWHDRSCREKRSAFRPSFLFWYSSIVAVFLCLASVAQAQTVPSDVETNPPESPAVVNTDTTELSAPIAPAVFGTSEEALLDQAVDLGAKDARVLQDSPWYGLKRFGRTFREAITLDPKKYTELKFHHANQELADMKQLVVEKGIASVSADVMTKTFAVYEQKLGAVVAQAENLKKEKQSDPEGVDALLNELTDTQLKQQRVFDSIVEDVIHAKEEGKEQFNAGEIDTVDASIDAVIARVEDTKKKSLEHLADVLVGVEDNSEAVGDRLTNALHLQQGSDFAPLKHLEVLETLSDSLSDSAPQSAHAAIAIAKTRTKDLFESKIKNIPPAVRAQKFDQYVADISADETKLFRLLEEIKLLPGVPVDILDRIEDNKEKMVRRFEKKLSTFDDVDAKQRLVQNFNPTGVANLVSLDDFRNRMSGDFGDASLITQAHEEALALFKQEFSDAESQEQADAFQKLSSEILTNPNPKTFRFLDELGASVRANPTKRAFLDKVEQNMKTQLEARFSEEGDKFFNRIATLDPEDISIYETAGFDQAFQDKMVSTQAGKLKQFAGRIEDPREFDTFYGRFHQVPQNVIDKIKISDPSFQQAMQFKIRKIEQKRSEQERTREVARATIDYTEREIQHQFGLLDQEKDMEFWEKYNALPWDDFEGRKALWEQKTADAQNRTEERFGEQKKLFEARLKVDPFGCDNLCQEVQLQFLDQDLRHQKERFGLDLKRERNRLESEKLQFQKNNPLSGKCTTPESCQTYCQDHSELPECGWAVVQVNPQCPPPSYWDSGARTCVQPPQQVQSCEPGFYFSFNTSSCVKDPYYVPPQTLVSCGWGMRWNPERSFCESTQVATCQPIYGANGTVTYPPECYKTDYHFCPGGFYWSDTKYDCVPQGYVECGQGAHFSVAKNQCESDTVVVGTCGPNQYWDFSLGYCISSQVTCPYFPSEPCPAGQYRESKQNSDGCWLPGQCVVDAGAKTFYTFSTGYTVYTYFEGEKYCKDMQSGGTLAGTLGTECKEKFGISSVKQPVTTQEWKQYTWVFADGSTQSSYILARTDAEYVNFVSGIAAKCKETSKFIQWVSGAGDTSNANAFGIPDCPGGKTVGIQYPFTFPSGKVCADEQSCKDLCKSFTAPTATQISTCEKYWPGNVKTVQQSCPATKANGYTSATSCSTSVCSNGCVYDGSGCPTSCKAVEVSCNYNGFCDANENESGCYSDCFKGNETACPAFAYSRWDTTNIRYCQLNAEKKCEFFYPAYLDKANYTSTECPSDAPITKCGDAVCNGAETSASCPADCGTYTTCTAGWHYDSVAKSCVKDGITCASPSPCDTCSGSNATANKWCQMDTNGCPSKCVDSTTPANCGDNICSSSETATSCPGDCGGTGKDWPGDATSCPGFAYSSWDGAGKRYCKLNTEQKCEYVHPAYLDQANYTAAECPSQIIVDSYCGDGGCISPETEASCPTDCKPAGPCPKTKANGNTGYYKCSDAECPNGCYYDNNACPSSCWEKTGSCNFNGTCDTASGENSTSCAADCSTTIKPACSDGKDNDADGSTDYPADTGCSSSTDTTETPDTSGTCGDKTCGSGETATSCPGDCGSTAACDFDKICEAGESIVSCPSDCHTDSSGTCSTYTTEATCKTGSNCSWHSTGYCYYQSSPTTGSCNNNGTCGDGETSSSCPADCGAYTTCGTGWHYDSTAKACVKDGITCATPNPCDASCTGSKWCQWDTNGCPSKCVDSTTPSTASCPSNEYNNYTTGYTCNSTKCLNGCSLDTQGCPSACKSSSGTAYVCGNAICDPGESTTSCPADCSQPSQSACTTNSYTTITNGAASCNYTTCPNGCTWTNSCPTSCYTYTSQWCGDHSCNNGETTATCAVDCPGTSSYQSLQDSTESLRKATTLNRFLISFRSFLGGILDTARAGGWLW